jgi:hypothetical protein
LGDLSKNKLSANSFGLSMGNLHRGAGFAITAQVLRGNNGLRESSTGDAEG